MIRRPSLMVRGVAVAAALALTAVAGSLAAAPPKPGTAAAKATAKRAPQVTAAQCALLDSPRNAGLMDGLLFYLARACGRQDEFIGQVQSEEHEPQMPGNEPLPDIPVSAPGGDTGTTRTQSESSIERNPTTGTLCAAWNDSFHGVTQDLGFSGFARSIDGGATWVDRGPISNDDSGDPSLVWRESDTPPGSRGFYYAALRNGGLGLYRSTDDCQNFTFVSQIATGNDDKEIMAIDNDPTSPFYGRIYVVWTDFTDARIYSIHSTNAGTSWSTQVALSAATDDVQGAWPTIAPNGDIYVSWIKWIAPGFPSGDVEAQVARSTNGGTSYTLLPPPMTGQDNPRDSAATSNCGRPALNGNVRYLPSPQVVYRGGFLHSVYTYDANGFGVGDVVDVYYRRFNVGTSTWDAEVKINDDATTRDQYQPTLSVGAQGQVTVAYYSRQNDPANLQIDYYSRTSFDNGATWTQPSVRLSDVSSSIVLDGQLANCYHGDYDQQLQDGVGRAHYLWSDDRGGTPPAGGGPDIYTDRTLVGIDYLVSTAASTVNVCSPTDAVYPLDVFQFQGFTEPVTLAASGNPAGSTVVFGTNPVTPPGTSTMTVTTTGVAFGSSTITITGTSAPSSIVHTATVGLNVYTAIPAAATLTAPADNATLVPVLPTFTWAAVPQAVSYTLEVDDENTFALPLVYTATVGGTSHTPATPVPSNSVLYWRVRATNTCGTGVNSATFSFTTVPLPGDCPIGASPVVSNAEGFEIASPPGWTLPAGTGTNSWALSNARFSQGAASFKVVDVATVTDQRLLSPPITLPTGLAPLSLIFDQWRDIEPNGAACYDAGILEITTNGGSSFTQLDAQIQTDPYQGTVSTCCSNPLQSLRGWCAGPTANFNRVVTDVNAFAGQTVQFRFRLGTDSSVAREGWYVDNFRVQGCSSGPLDDMFRNGFEDP